MATEGNCVVIDNGSDTIKAGYAHSVPERGPQVVLASVVSRVDGAEGGAGGGQQLRPVRRGIVQDWDMMESIYSYILYDQLCWTPGREGSVVLAEPLFTPKADREAFAQLMFETFNVSGMFVSEQPVLSLYGMGRVSGICLDLGAEKTDLCAVYEGMPLAMGAKRQEWGGADIDAFLSAALARRGQAAFSLAHVRAAKEALAQVPLERWDPTSPCEPARHTLPDGQVLELGPERFAAGEGLFDASLLPGRLAASLSEEILAAISFCNSEYRRSMYDAVLLCGGGSGMKGLSERITADMAQAAPATARVGCVAAPEYLPADALRHAAWYGGAIISKIVFPQNQHISKIDYHEFGPRVVSRMG